MQAAKWIFHCQASLYSATRSHGGQCPPSELLFGQEVAGVVGDVFGGETAVIEDVFGGLGALGDFCAGHRLYAGVAGVGGAGFGDGAS